MNKYFLALLLATTQLLTAQTPPAKPSPAECAVWQRELTFAQSVEKHDAAAFAAHLHPGAVFNAGTADPTRGSDAVLKAWASLIEGKQVRLRWHPDVVNIGGDPNVAFSHGPYLIEDLSPDAKVKFRVGTFTSIWVKQPATGQWLILFDGAGSSPTEVKDLKEAEDHLARAPKTCPSH